MLSASIVAYKHTDTELLKPIRSLRNATCVDEIHLIDNSPTDALRAWAERERLSYHFNPANPGYGAAHNIAIRKSLTAGQKYHLVLNPDVYFAPGTLEDLLNFMESSPATGRRLVFPDFFRGPVTARFRWKGRNSPGWPTFSSFPAGIRSLCGTVWFRSRWSISW